MKVALMVPVLITGGAETMVVRLAKNIDLAQADVEVISMYPRQGTALEKEIEEAGIPIHYVGKQSNGSLKAALSVYRLLNQIKPDVIHSHIYSTFYALPWAMLHRARVVHTIHTKPDVEFSRKLTILLKVLVKLKKVIMVAVSKENHALAKEYYNADDTQVKYVNNPVETQRYYHDSERRDHHIVFINVSRQDVNKNQILAVHAMKKVIEQVPNARMVFVGDGNQHENLIRASNELGLGDVIDFPGESHEVEGFLAKADVYLSMSHREGLPLSMLEAMASGLPVIATNVGGVPDIVRDNGVLIEDDNCDQLAAEMIRFARDAQLRERCARRSVEIAAEFDAKACANAYVNIYRENMKQR